MKMISNVCIYQFVRVSNDESKTLLVDSVPFVHEFPKAFHNDLHGIPSEWEIDFSIDILPDTQHISIPPYRMDMYELKELKVQLKIFQIRVLFDRVSLKEVPLWCLLESRMGLY